MKTQYLLQPPGALTSCKASPVYRPASGWLAPWVPFFQEALCGRGFGQEFEVPANAVSPALSFCTILTDMLDFSKKFDLRIGPFILHFWSCYDTVSFNINRH